MSKIMDTLRHFDAYPKTADDYRIKTYSGAAITVASAVIIVLLFISELYTFMSPNVLEELFVDTSRGPKLKINLDIVVPSISCDYLVLDAMDSSGEQHLHIDHNIYKRRLSLDGKPIEEPKKEEIVTVSAKPKTAENETTEIQCGSCYGAADRCCNTCEDVKEAYRIKRWSLPGLENFVQCKDEHSAEKSKTAFLEGCQIYGSMEVNRVGGSFHVAPGQSFSINHVHVHDVQPYSSSSFNTTHVIRHLSFGSRILSGSNSPLDDTTGLATEGAMMFQYYIKIVPTMYVNLNGSVLYTNQFSVTRHHKSVTAFSGESGMPGAFFSYELSPLMVKYTERERSFGHFATSVCAIVGGVFTAAGILDTLLYHSVRAIEGKLQIGKVN